MEGNSFRQEHGEGVAAPFMAQGAGDGLFTGRFFASRISVRRGGSGVGAFMAARVAHLKNLPVKRGMGRLP